MSSSDRKFLSFAVPVGVLFSAIILIPFFAPRLAFWCRWPINSLTAIRDHTTVVAAISAAVLSFAGLYLGHLHFKRRASFDADVLSGQRNRELVQRIWDYLDGYSESLDLISYKSFADESELLRLRRKAMIHWDNLVACLDSTNGVEIFSTEERGIMLELHSVVDNDELLLHGSIDEVLKRSSGALCDVYDERYRMARRVCISRLVSSDHRGWNQLLL